MQNFYTTQKLPPIKYVIGVDEVGRGPLAGPVAVGAVIFPAKKIRPSIISSPDFLPIPEIPNHLLSARDSKQLTPMAREIWFERIQIARQAGELDYKVAFVGPDIIDKKGIMFALRAAITRTLSRLSADPRETLILLDGGIFAPDHFLFQKTIIGGDILEPVISLASIAAKVLRDRKMWRLAEEYPHFGFEMHKGYGTRFHFEKLEEHGPCEIHRKSFLTHHIDKRQFYAKL